MAELTQERLRQVLSYDPETGEFRRLVTSGGQPAGSVAGGYHSAGYREIRVDDRPYRAHRLAWLYVHGRWPAAHIDHINGVRDDNRLVNLREATIAQNNQNIRAMLPRNSSGFTGVFWDKRQGAWRAEIKVNRKKRHIGYFDTAEAGHAAYLKAKAELHPFQTIAHGDKP